MTGIISPIMAILAALLNFAFLGGIIWLVVFLIQKRQKQRQEELDKLIDQKVEAKLKELQTTQNLSADQDADNTTS